MKFSFVARYRFEWSFSDTIRRRKAEILVMQSTVHKIADLSTGFGAEIIRHWTYSERLSILLDGTCPTPRTNNT